MTTILLAAAFTMSFTISRSWRSSRHWHDMLSDPADRDALMAAAERRGYPFDEDSLQAARKERETLWAELREEMM